MTILLQIIIIMANRISHAPENKIEPCLPTYQRVPNIINNQSTRSRVNKNSVCANCSHEKNDSRNISCDDGNTMEAFKCSGCGKVICNCKSCDNVGAWYKDRKSANRHRRKYHRLDSSTSSIAIENNEVDENHEQALAMDSGFDIRDVERELQEMDYFNDLWSEDEKHREFTKHLNKDTVGNYLVALSQDKRCTEARFKNLWEGDIELQLKLTKLHNELSPKQQLKLGEVINLVIKSLNKREKEDSFISFTHIPCARKEIQHICLNSKSSIMKNMPMPKIQCDDDLAVTSPIEPAKHALMIGRDIARIRAREVEQDIDKCMHNSIADGAGVKKEIRELAMKCNKTDKDITIIPVIEFRDGFNASSSLTTNEGLLYHSLTLQSRDSTHDTFEQTYPVTFGHKSKENMINETTHIKEFNRRENPANPFKVCSKIDGGCTWAILHLLFTSMDQLEKRSYTLFSGGNSKYGATCGMSCNWEDILWKILPCSKCVKDLSKGKNNMNCKNCWNLELSRARYSKSLVDSLNGYTKKPHELTMDMQEKKGKEIYNKIVDGKISIQEGRTLLKTICLPDEAITLILDSAIIRNAQDNDTMDMHDLSGFHSQIDRSNLNGIGFPDFAIYHRKHLTHNKLSGSPMHNLFLGKLCRHHYL